MKKRVLAMAMALCLALSLLPVTAGAAEMRAEEQEEAVSQDEAHSLDGYVQAFADRTDSENLIWQVRAKGSDAYFSSLHDLLNGLSNGFYFAKTAAMRFLYVPQAEYESTYDSQTSVTIGEKRYILLTLEDNFPKGEELTIKVGAYENVEGTETENIIVDRPITILYGETGQTENYNVGITFQKKITITGNGSLTFCNDSNGLMRPQGSFSFSEPIEVQEGGELDLGAFINERTDPYTTYTYTGTTGSMIEAAKGSTVGLHAVQLVQKNSTAPVIDAKGTVNITRVEDNSQTGTTVIESAGPAIAASSTSQITLDTPNITTTAEDGKTITLSQGTKVTMGGITITASAGESYVDNNGIALLSAGATMETGDTSTPLLAAALLSDGTLVQGSTTEAPAVDSVTGNVTVPAGGSVTQPNGTEQILPYGGTVSGDGTVTKNPDPTPEPDPTPSGSDNSEPSYSPVMDVSDGGTVRVNPRTPSEGDRVTLTVTPDSGYGVGGVTVTDRSGRGIDVTANRDGTYTFTQPRGRVTISVEFVREGGAAFFADVPETYWAYDEIAWASGNGYVNGTTATTFSPGASVSRQQVWMILARLSGADPADMTAARVWAVENGISDGTNPGTAVTRQQLAALLFRFAQSNGYDNGQRSGLSAFPDAGDAAAYAVEPLRWATAGGIISGTSQGTLNPAGTATRAQFTVMLYRFWTNV